MYWGRYLTAVVGGLVIYLTYLVAKKYFGSNWTALLASIFVALNYRLVLNSMVGFPDMYNVLFLLLSLLLTHSLMKKPNLNSYIKVWIGAALSFLVKYQIYALIPLFLAHLNISLQQAKGNIREFALSFFSRKVIIGGLISFTIVFLVHGQYFVQWEKVSSINTYEAVKYGFGRNIINIFPLSYLYHIGAGPLLFIAFVLGLIYGLIKKKSRLSTLLLASPLSIFFFIYFYYTGGGFHTRNLISLLPVMLIFSALIPGMIIDCVQKKTLPWRVLTLLLMSLFVYFAVKDHVTNDTVLIREYSSVTSYDRLGKWLGENIKGDVVYGAYPGNPVPSDPKVKVKYIGPTAQAFSSQELIDEGFDYLTLDFTDVVNPNFLFWMGQPTKIGLLFWNKPDDLLSQNFIALAAREYLWSHTLKTFLAPWQAPGFSYAVFKTKSNVNNNVHYTKFTTLNSADFAKWSSLYLLPEHRSSFQRPEERNTGLELTGTSLPGSVRWQSPVMPTDPNYAYKITGKINSKTSLSKTARDGFIRLDFYQSLPLNKITDRSVTTFISQRVYGESGPHFVEINAVAPDTAGYMTISFQVEGSNPLLLEEVKIQKSDTELTGSLPPVTIPDNNLFLPSLNGFL